MDSVILLSVLQFSDGLNLFKQVGFSVMFLLFILERFFSWSNRGFLINHNFVVNSSRNNVNNFRATEFRYVYQKNYSKSKSFSFFIRTPKTWI